MSERVTQHLERALGLYRDLIDTLPADALSRRLPDLPSNTIGEQLWCVVGARESYSKAIEHGGWRGFACSLSGDDTTDEEKVARQLEASAQRVLAVMGGAASFDDPQSEYALDLLEHETQHHGQLIRYLYALKLDIPRSWKDRYALD